MRFMLKLISPLYLSLLAPLASLQAAEGDRVSELKQEIKTIALANIDRTDNFPEVRKQLQPLVDELIGLVPNQPEAEKLALVAGGWRNLWSDQRFGPGVDPKQVYQAVSPEGYYYNISLIKSPIGDFTGFLRGAYTDGGNFLNIEFTSNAVRKDFYAPGTPLLALAQDFEAGNIKSLPVPGPIGVTGVLINAYVDQDFRVVTGNSKVNSNSSLFILERADVIAP